MLPVILASRVLTDVVTLQRSLSLMKGANASLVQGMQEKVDNNSFSTHVRFIVQDFIP